MKRTDVEAEKRKLPNFGLFIWPALVAIVAVLFDTPKPQSLLLGVARAAFIYAFVLVSLLAIRRGLRLFHSLFRGGRGDSRE